MGRLGQLLRSEVLDTRQIDRDIALAQQKKRRLIDGIAEGVLDRHDLLVTQKLAEIDDELLVLATRRDEIVRVVGSDLDADAIAAKLLERVNDLADFLDTPDVETQRTALFAFCRKITADAQRREIVIETDLMGMAQNETPPGLPAGLCNNHLPERWTEGPADREKRGRKASVARRIGTVSVRKIVSKPKSKVGATGAN